MLNAPPLPSVELCPAPFLGLTVQPCGEPSDSVQCWSGIRFMVCLCEENHLVPTYSAFLNGGKSNPLFFNEHLIALDMTVKMLCNCLASSYESRGKKLHKQGVLLSQGWNLKLSSKICVHQYPPSPPPARLTSSIYTFHGYVFIITCS
ncbi:unnamed protein product [Sphagnum troendelagicum]